MAISLSLIPICFYASAVCNTPKSPIHSKTKQIWDTFKDNLGEVIRNTFFLPLAGRISKKSQLLLDGEKAFFQKFWDVSKPTNPQIPLHEEIRNSFNLKTETFDITVHGKSLQVDVCVIESKGKSSETPQNLAFILGNLSTLDNDIMTPYPFLASYAEKAKENPSIAPFRGILISHYATKENGSKYAAKTMDEAGLILTETLKQIYTQKGPVAQVIAHSLGTIILSSALKHLASENGAFPKNIYFDRGASSVENLSTLFGLLGRISLPISRLTGWDVNIGHEIAKHLSNRPNQTIYMSEALKDHRFPGPCSLLNSPHIAGLGTKNGFFKFSFDFSAQLFATAGHHNLHNGQLDGHHLISTNSEKLKNEETMAEKIMDLIFNYKC